MKENNTQNHDRVETRTPERRFHDVIQRNKIAKLREEYRDKPIEKRNADGFITLKAAYPIFVAKMLEMGAADSGITFNKLVEERHIDLKDRLIEHSAHFVIKCDAPPLSLAVVLRTYDDQTPRVCISRLVDVSHLAPFNENINCTHYLHDIESYLISLDEQGELIWKHGTNTLDNYNLVGRIISVITDHLEKATIERESRIY